MIKTLRITSVVAAVLAVAFFAFPAVFGVRGDEQSERFLDSASVIEKFKKLRSGKSAKGRSQESPLVKEAKAFALYLNPPPKRRPRPRPSRRTGTPTTPKTPVIATPQPLGPVSSKFTLIGTVYYASHPELSLVLIDEPGKGLHWVRQFGKVGHLIIEEVKDGLVVVRDRQRTFELVPKRAETRSLLKGKGSPSGKTGPRATSTVSAPAASFLPAPPRLPAGTTASSAKKSGPPQMSAEKSAAMEKLMSGLKAVRDGAQSDKAGSKRSDEEAMVLMGKLLSDFQSTRISAEEAKRLDRLGKELKDTTDDPNRPRSRKIERPKSSQEPNSPAKK